ncbi:MAG: prephenate dehydratase [Gammaproteobacteria bacterium]|nr:MAG: prephenate dehydratase [Gammaproteobacteria bacterium]
MSKQALYRIREKIDALDEQIQTLITQRAICAEQVAEAKRAEVGKGDDLECYRPAREAEVLKKVIQRNQGPLKDQELTLVFQEIMSACRRIQRALRIAFLGPEGTFTQMATFKHFGHSIHASPESTIEEVFRSVSLEHADFGVIPIENSIEGSVTHAVDQFANHAVKICGEVQLPIHHCLLSQESSLAEITRVYAHQQAFSQCKKWLQQYLPDAERVAVSSNAEGAVIASQTRSAAAIACEGAAELYALACLERNIEDDVNNTTRFLVIGQKDSEPTGEDKTSLLLSAPNRPGSLYQLLQPFARHDISMTRIESRPSRVINWEYVFFIDIRGHHTDNNVASALGELQETASFFKLLGSYPCRVH